MLVQRKILGFDAMIERFEMVCRVREKAVWDLQELLCLEETGR